jgi:hypothetical protein
MANSTLRFRRRQARQYPIHTERMREAVHKLLNNPIVAEDLRQGIELEIRRDVRQKLIGIELAHSNPTHSARPGWNGEDIGISVIVARAASASLSTNSASVYCCQVANIVCCEGVS